MRPRQNSNDYRNNVLYNWGYQSSCGGEAHQKGDPTEFVDYTKPENNVNPLEKSLKN